VYQRVPPFDACKAYRPLHQTRVKETVTSKEVPAKAQVAGASSYGEEEERERMPVDVVFTAYRGCPFDSTIRCR
jgi:hypothetical protein